MQPPPKFVGRIGNVDLQRGETFGAFRLWPGARPAITVDRGERLSLAVRIRPASDVASEMQLLTKPIDHIDFKLRPETKGTGYWLDISAGPFDEPGTHPLTIELATLGDPSPAVKVQLSVNVLAENIIATPNSMEIGELSISSLRVQPRSIGRLGIRKLTGAFRITAVSSSLQFIQVEQQTIVEGNNYLIRLSSDPKLLPKPGSYKGIIRIETDDSRKPRIEVAISLIVVDR